MRLFFSFSFLVFFVFSFLFKTALKNHLYKQYKTTYFKFCRLLPPLPQSPLPVTFPLFPCVGDWVCICTGRGAVGWWGRKNTVLCPYTLVGFCVYIFVHLVRRGVLVLVGDRNIDRNCAIEMTIILLWVICLHRYQVR